MKRFHQEVNLPRVVYSVKEMSDIKPVGEWVINNNIGINNNNNLSLVDTTCESNYCKHFIMIIKLIEKGINDYKTLEN